jgi:hypothetical protein
MKKQYLLAIIIVFAALFAGLLAYIGSRRVPPTPAPRGDPNTFSISYSSSNHERGWTKDDLFIPSDEDKVFLDSVLTSIFPKVTDDLSNEEKSIEILRYVASYLRLKRNGGTATKILRDGSSLCGGVARAFIILCRKTGIPARYVNSAYLPSLSSHTASEVFYEGKWHLFDPTFGVFFYSNPDYDRGGWVLSFHELFSAPYEGAAFKVVSRPWTGQYDESVRAFGVIPVEDGYLKGKYGDSVITLYRRDLEEAFPVSYDGDTVSYPVDANLSAERSQWFGQVDGANEELLRFRKTNSDLYKVRFFGNGGLSASAYHTWLIKAPPNSVVSIEYYSVDANPSKLVPVPLRAAKVIESRNEDDKFVLTVRVSDPEAIVSVYCPEGSFTVDAMHAYR